MATEQFSGILEPSVQDKTKLNSLVEETLGGGGGNNFLILAFNHFQIKEFMNDDVGDIVK